MTKMERIPEQSTVNGVTFNADLSNGPFFVDGHDTLPKLWLARCQELQDKTAHREKHKGIWRSSSWSDYLHRARLIGLGLRKLGLERGDVVSVLSEDNKEWVYTDLGVQSMGGIVSGIYTTDAASQVEYLVNDSTSKFVFVENDEQLDKYLAVADKLPTVQKVIVYDGSGLHALSDDRIMFLDDLYKVGEEEFAQHATLFEDEIAKGKNQDIALLVYTSGTTGMPKGVEISQGNILCSLGIAQHKIPVFPNDEQVCFLPLCHILERLISVCQHIAGRTVVNFAESPETVFECIQEVSPSVFTSVPRVWEKIYSRVSVLLSDGTPFARWVFDRAVSAGKARAELEIAGQSVPASLKAQTLLWDLVVLRNVRRTLGLNRLRRGLTGAAPISADLLLWYRAIGVKIYEGYGMSETTAIISVSTEGNLRLGAVGTPVEPEHVRIAEDGEIQYKAGNLFCGYWGKPEKTAETMTEDGWLRTGDVGTIDDEGFLKITGRLKDIIITAGGKNITPAEIENRLKVSPYISDAVVIGDGRKFLSLLVMIDQENVEKFAQDKRVPFSNFASLCAAKPVQELVGQVVEEVNKDFARVEQIKAFRLIDTLLSAEDEEVTATMKLKRSAVETKHKALIDSMYKS